MARLHNSPPEGARVADLDIDSPTFARTIEYAQGDLAYVYDKITGENAEPDTIDHSGGGRGCPLGAPLMNACGIDADLTVTTSMVQTDVYLAAVPFRLPPGETTLDAMASIQFASFSEAGTSVTFEVRLTDWSLVTDATINLQNRFTESDGVFNEGTGTCSGLSSGTNYIALILMRAWSNPLYTIATLKTVSFGWFRQRTGQGWSYAIGSDSDIVDVVDPGTSPLYWQDIEGTITADEEALDAQKLCVIDRNINSLAEYMLGVPAGGNAAFRHADTSSVAPTRSEFLAHSRANFASEPEPFFPLYAQACGAIGAVISKDIIVVDDAEPPTTGMLGWYTPWRKSGAISATAVPIANGYFTAPHFKNGASSNLKAMALLAADGTGLVSANWTVSFRTGTGSAVAGTLSVVTNTNSRLWLATATGIDFTPDATNACTVFIRSTAARAIRELCLVGFFFYWEP